MWACNAVALERVWLADGGCGKGSGTQVDLLTGSLLGPNAGREFGMALGCGTGKGSDTEKNLVKARGFLQVKDSGRGLDLKSERCSGVGMVE